MQLKIYHEYRQYLFGFAIRLYWSKVPQTSIAVSKYKGDLGTIELWGTLGYSNLDQAYCIEYDMNINKEYL